MDLLTHALIGAGAGAASRHPAQMHLGAAAGAVAALAVDLDYFIGSPEDPLLQIELHRHFSHSLLFAPVGAAIVALLLWPLLGRRLGAGALYLAALAGYATNPLLDLFTSYGVHLFWPITDQRFSLDLISVIDPVFTLAVAVPLAFALWQRRQSSLALVLVSALAYLGFSFWQQQQAGALAMELAAERGHEPRDLLLRPSFANTVLWRSTYRHQDRIFIDAIRPGTWAEPNIYPGASVPAFDRERDLPGIPADSRMARDIHRFEHLSDGYLIWVSSERGASTGRLGDIRFSSVPTGALPMWGLEFDPTQPETAPEWFVDRKLTPSMRQRFLDQLMGREP